MPRSVLIRHFFGRFFDQELLSPGSEAQASVVPLIALLAVPGFFVSLYMMPGYARANGAGLHWQASADRLFFLTYAMASAGFATVFEWERLFPDRRDFLILLPLPIRARDLFLAKVLALGLFIGLFLVAANGVSFVLLPLLTSRGGAAYLLRTVFAHLTAVLAGGLFMAFALGAVQGVLLQVRALRRVVPLLQMLLLAMMVVSLVSFPVAGVLLRPLVQTHDSRLFWSPYYWFLGLYEVLLPDPDPVFWPLARAAWTGLLAAVSLFLFTYATAYWRHARRILEAPEDVDSGSGLLARSWTRQVSDRLAANPQQRAVLSFISQTLFRSPRHRLFLATQGGLGLAFGLSLLFSVVSRSGRAHLVTSDAGLLSFCMSLAFFLMSGLRAAFQFPVELRANWVFQLSEDENRQELLAGTRKWIWFYAALPLQLALFPLKLTRLSVGAAIASTAFEFLVSVVLAELFFFHFLKAPFTCSYFPGKTNLAVLIAAYVYGFTFYAITMADAELYLMARPLAMAAALALGAWLLTMMVRRRNTELREGFTLDFEDRPDPLVRSLNLRP